MLNTTAKSAPRPLKPTESGLMVPLLALLVAALIGLAVLVVNTGYSGVVVAELQAAADAASLAGAGQYCSSKKCYENARRAAIEVLALHIAHSSIGEDISLAVDPNNPGYQWDLSASRNLKITVERGWKHGTNAFEPMEGGWQAQHPGVPVFVAANAVRITLERPQTSIIDSLLGSGDYSLSASATAVAERSASFCAAPLAVPVCALIDDSSGDYYGDGDAKELCYGDRVFAQADRYCAGGDCTAMPSIPYTMCDANYQSAYDSDTTLFFPDADSYNTWLQSKYSSPPVFSDPGQYCHVRHGVPINRTHDQPDWGWNGQQRFTAASDHYGVVGLPRDVVPADPGLFELEIQNVLQQSDSCEQTELGRRFSVLEGGLQTPLSEDVIWDAIVDNIDPTIDENHPEFGQSGLGTLDRFNPRVPFQGAFYYQPPEYFPLFPDGPGDGICNSKRMRLVNHRVLGVAYLADLDLQPGVDDQTRVWKRNISVIADVSPGAAPCAGIDGATEDPVFDPSHEHVVIGHVEAFIYDADIGQDPPDGSELTGGAPISGWGFQQRCNNVRARLACERPFIPGDIHSAVRTPMLVK